MTSGISGKESTPQDPADQNFLIEQLAMGRRAILDSIADVAEKSAGLKPQPDRWSILECLEHVVSAEIRMLGMIETAQPGARSANASMSEDRAFLARCVDRSRGLDAPQPVRPRSRYGSLEQAGAQFLDARAKTETYVMGSETNLRDLRLVHAHPMLGLCDAHTCCLLIAAHGMRHAAQIREIRAALGINERK